MDQQHNETSTLIDYVPSSWFTDCTKSSVWVGAYRAYDVAPDQAQNWPQTIVFSDVCMVFGYGQLSHLICEHADFEVNSKITIKIKQEDIREKWTLVGFHVLVFTPYNTDGKSRTDHSVERTIDTVVALLGLFGGRKAVFEHLFSQIINMDGKGVILYPELNGGSKYILNRAIFPQPDFRQKRIQDIQKAYEVIQKLPEKDNSRFLLSLRWFKSGFYDFDNDAYLKYWIALESLFDSTNKFDRQIYDILGVTYGIESENVKNNLNFSNFIRLRKRIVHHGYSGQVDRDILTCLESVYFDILLSKLGLPPEKRSFEFAKQSNVRFTKLLCNIEKTSFFNPQ